MATITYTSNASVATKPTVINVYFTLYSEYKEIKPLMKTMNSERNRLKNFILNKASYIEDSYTQTTITIDKLEHTRYIYINKDNPLNMLNEDEYFKLPANLQSQYKRQTITEFDGYSSQIRVSAKLKKSDTLVKDFSSLASMCVNRNIHFRYDCNISNEERYAIEKQLFIDCSNKGISAIKEIASGIGYTNVNIVSINEPEFGNSHAKFMCDMDRASVEKEQIVMPEIIKDIFENNLYYNRTLKIVAEMS